jgi:hypothetical protein
MHIVNNVHMGTRKVTNCAKTCGNMASHVIFEVSGLQQLALEEVVPGKGVRYGRGRRVKRTGAYDANWLAFIKMARTIFGPTPRPREEKPSSFTIYGHSEITDGSVLSLGLTLNNPSKQFL